MKLSLIYIIIITTVFRVIPGSYAQSRYWIEFTDKDGSSYAIERPLEFLSERAVERRIRQNIIIDSTDLPVSKVYTDSILNTGASLIHTSKWLNGITVSTERDSLAAVWDAFDFVRDVQLTKRSGDFLKNARSKFTYTTDLPPANTSYYGASTHQIRQINLEPLHEMGYTGIGMIIALLDAGYYKAAEMPALAHLFSNGRILGVKDFAGPNADVFEEHEHGMMVLSVIGANLPGQMVGTAPEASFWLIRTEDASGEYLTEEDNWVAGAEFADSAGADILNSSLGYHEFDDPAMNHFYSDMDGKTTRVTLGASMAAQKGMLVFNSAGNEARTAWKHIIAPADGIDVVAVGAVDQAGLYASFSSVGPSAGGNIKPDLAALGSGTAVQTIDGNIANASGTSFSSPLLAGAAACLWRANPDATAFEIAASLKASGHLSTNPDNHLGYGIPEIHLAHNILNRYSNNKPLPQNPAWQVYPNPFRSGLTVSSSHHSSGKIEIEILTLTGLTVAADRTTTGSLYHTLLFSELPEGFYMLRISGNGVSETHKIIKIN
jgi:serine protease AprX